MWAAISARGILGPYFFDNESGVAVTARAENYCEMLWEFLIPAIREFRGHNSRTWFKQDGASCHTARDLLKEIFNGKLTSRQGDIEWPPRSPDLTPNDYFLWGYLKSKVYEGNPTTTIKLKRNIVREINAIPIATCRRVFENL